MQLTVRDVSKLLNVSERTIYRWIKEGSITAYRIKDQYRFNRSEILEWATANKIGVSPEIFKEPEESANTLPTLYNALKLGGIHYRVNGHDKESVLKSVVEILHLPLGIDKDNFLKFLIAREELGSTGIGDGIAIPHPRTPIIMNVPSSIVALCFLENPIDFKAVDGKPVYCLFMLISATVRAHLGLLSRIAFFLKNPETKEIMAKHGARDEIMNLILRLETEIDKKQG